MTKRLSHLYVATSLKALGFTLLSTYKDAKSPINIKCTLGHLWTTRWDAARKTPCAYCIGKAHKTECDYKELGISNKLVWAGKLPQKVTDKTNWKCSNGHKFTRPYSSILVGNVKCPKCNIPPNIKTRKTEQDYTQLADKLEIKWNGPLPQNSDSKTWWTCSKDHHFFTTYGVVSKSTKFCGCSQCSRHRTGAQHPNWMGGHLAVKIRSRIKRQHKLSRTPNYLSITEQQWNKCKKFFGYRCAYCRKSVKLEVDHLIPISKNGLHTVTNVVPACRTCNTKKNCLPPRNWISKNFPKSMKLISRYFLSIIY